MRLWLPRGLAAATFLLYVVAAPSGVFWLDSGELSAAALGLGSPHPTGFPLFCVIAKLASLIPLGELAFRINVMCALCGAIAVLSVCRLVQEVCKNDTCAVMSAVGAGASLALSLTFFRQATVAEVYAPTAAAMALALRLLIAAAYDGKPRAALLAAVVAGLGVGLHITFCLTLPVFAVYVVLRLRRGARWPLVLPVVTFAIAAGLYAYLPIRASTGRTIAVDWGHPRTASALIAHVRGQRIRAAFRAKDGVDMSDREMASVRGAVVVHNAGQFSGEMAGQLGPVVLLAALAGVFWLVRRRGRRWIGVSVCVVLVGDWLYSVWLNPMGLVDLQVGVPFSLAACIAAGAGVAWFARSLGGAAPFAASACAAIMAASAGIASWDAIWHASRGDAPRQWAEAAFASTPPGGVLLVQNDSTAAGLMYLGVSESARPDVAMIVRQHMVGDAERSAAVVRRAVRGRTFDVRAPVSSLLSQGAAIVWEPGRGVMPNGFELQYGLPVGELRLRGTRASGDLQTAFDGLEHLAQQEGMRDRSARRVQAVALVGLGIEAFRRREMDRAQAAFDLALAIRPGHTRALLNRGTVSAARRDFAEAMQFAERALARDPNYVSARVQAARWSLRRQDIAAAVRHLERARDLAPTHASALALSAVVALRSNDIDRALRYLRRAHASDPGNADVRDLTRQLENERK